MSFGHSYQFACLLYNGVSQPFLEPETSLVEADFPTDPKGVGGGFRVTQAHDTYRALDFFSCYISCTQSIRRQIPEAADPTSEHQASDPGRCGPHLRPSGVRSQRLRTPALWGCQFLSHFIFSQIHISQYWLNAWISFLVSQIFVCLYRQTNWLPFVISVIVFKCRPSPSRNVVSVAFTSFQPLVISFSFFP